MVRVVSVDIDHARTALARENLERAGLDVAGQLRTEDAATTLANAPDGEMEFIFLDSRAAGLSGLPSDLVRTLAPGGVLAMDNVISHESELNSSPPDRGDGPF